MVNVGTRTTVKWSTTIRASHFASWGSRRRSLTQSDTKRRSILANRLTSPWSKASPSIYCERIRTVAACLPTNSTAGGTAEIWKKSWGRPTTTCWPRSWPRSSRRTTEKSWKPERSCVTSRGMSRRTDRKSISSASRPPCGTPREGQPAYRSCSGTSATAKRPSWLSITSDTCCTRCWITCPTRSISRTRRAGSSRLAKDWPKNASYVIQPRRSAKRMRIFLPSNTQNRLVPTS